MSRTEFMNELRTLLQDIPEEEREEALQYYSDYFDDAGAENEEQVIRELGSPQKVAATIKDGLGGQNRTESEEYREYRETGYQDTRYEEKEPPAQKKRRPGEGKNSTAVKILLILLIILVGVPVVIPAAGGILAGVAGLIRGILAILFGLLVGGVVMVIVGFALAAAGLTQMFYSPGTMFGLMGAGFICIALGLVFTAFIWWIFLKIVPPVFRWVVNICRRPFQKRREGNQQ